MPRDSIAATYFASVAPCGMPGMIDHSRGFTKHRSVRAASGQERFSEPLFRTFSTELSEGILLHATSIP